MVFSIRLTKSPNLLLFVDTSPCADEVEEVDIEKDKEDEDEESLQPPKKRKK